MPEQTLNIPGLIAVAVFGFLAIRWLLSSTSAASSNNNTAGARSARGRVDANAVEQVAQMFPQLNRRDIQWDLQMNGGNVAATTERVLSGFGLETVCSFCILPGRSCGAYGLHFDHLPHGSEGLLEIEV